MNLIFDIGNTLVKVSLFEQGKEIFNERYIEFSENDLDFILRKHRAIQNTIISKVRDLAVLSSIRSKLPNVLELNNNTAFPITINYGTPDTLGNDRIAACVGANTMFPGENVLVIDAGTAITFDFIDKTGTYEGGNISPGLTTRFRSLHQFTGKLPLVSPEEDHSLIGKSTSQAISGGVWFGMIYEILGYINEYKIRFGDLKTLLTGGDAQKIMEKLKNIVLYKSEHNYFVKELKNSIFVVLNLNMAGLNRILEYNVRKN